MTVDSAPARHGIAILGVTGRMGQSLLRCLAETADSLALSGALAGANSSRLGRDAAADGGATGVLITADIEIALRGAAVAVDFSRAEFVAAHAQACARARVPLLVGTTGLDEAARAALQAASAEVAVLVAPNTSVGVGVMAQLVRFAATSLGAGFDVEITDAHHRFKRDAPSGTALALGEVVADARGQRLDDVAVFERHGVMAVRRAGSIGFSAVRAGDIVGEHSVIFAASGERLEITHRATDRAAFARGALRAAGWLVARRAGLYGMENMLGLR